MMEIMPTSRNKSIRIVDAFAATDPGFRRGNNEDACITDPEHGFFVVADGMGGHAGGEIASAIASQTAHKYFLKSTGDIRQTLRGAFQAADMTVKAYGQGNAKYANMGTTMVALVTRGDRAWVAHCGDSRAYIHNSGLSQLSQLTQDHGYGHVVSRAIGCAFGIGADVKSMPVRKGDVFLLCSDGLSAFVDKDLIARELLAVNASKSCKSACGALIDHALDAGGPDNVTVVVVKLG